MHRRRADEKKKAEREKCNAKNLKGTRARAWRQRTRRQRERTVSREKRRAARFAFAESGSGGWFLSRPCALLRCVRVCVCGGDGVGMMDGDRMWSRVRYQLVTGAGDDAGDRGVIVG